MRQGHRNGREDQIHWKMPSQRFSPCRTRPEVVRSIRPHTPPPHCPGSLDSTRLEPKAQTAQSCSSKCTIHLIRIAKPSTAQHTQPVSAFALSGAHPELLVLKKTPQWSSSSSSWMTVPVRSSDTKPVIRRDTASSTITGDVKGEQL